MKHRLLMIGMIVFCLGMFYMATGPPVMTARAADTQALILAPGFDVYTPTWAAITALPASNAPVSLSLKELEQEYITNLINDCESQRHDDLNSGNCSALTNTSIRYTITAFVSITRHDDDRNYRAAPCKAAFGKKTPVCIV